jgi:hypothetical protein
MSQNLYIDSLFQCSYFFSIPEFSLHVIIILFINFLIAFINYLMINKQCFNYVPDKSKFTNSIS